MGQGCRRRLSFCRCWRDCQEEVKENFPYPAEYAAPAAAGGDASENDGDDGAEDELDDDDEVATATAVAPVPAAAAEAVKHAGEPGALLRCCEFILAYQIFCCCCVVFVVGRIW